MTEAMKLTFMLALAALVVLAPDAAFAAGGGTGIDAFSDKLCGIVDEMSGTTGTAVATIVIILMGLGAFFGKLNWGFVVMVIVALVAFFAAPEIVDFLSDSAEGC